jgi:hypothetical protein
MQAITPAFLNVIRIGERSYVLKELMPRQDRLHLELWDGKLARLERVAVSMGAVTAWAHLRGAGWRDTVPREDIVAFGTDTSWHARTLEYAWQYAKTVKEDWKAFRTAAAAGNSMRRRERPALRQWVRTQDRIGILSFSVVFVDAKTCRQRATIREHLRREPNDE